MVDAPADLEIALTLLRFIVRLSIDSLMKKCQMHTMKDSQPDPKQQTILDAAWQSFSTYGFRKTSMDDIARAAGMSRPALYLRYRNKEDICRSLVRFYYETSVQRLTDALATDGPVPEVLSAAFLAQGGEIIEKMLSSPHGVELLDAGSAIAADIVEAGEAELRAVYATWLKDQARAGHLRFSGTAEDVAATITAALKGMKTLGPSFASYQLHVAQLGRLIGAGLSA
jgi:AcrR family transcriptional regulator